MLEEIAALKVEAKPQRACQNGEEKPCIFYKHEICTPEKIKFKICLKCHRCKVITIERAIPEIFNRIVALAGLLMATFGAMGGAGAGQGAGAGGSTGGGGGSGGGGGGSGGGGGGGGGK